jgi:hypothetical protein
MQGQPQIFQFNPEMAPDSDFEPGELRHLVADNRGRLLDPRRTPVRLTAVHLETGMFEVELLDFEDKGAHWLHPLETVDKYQFAVGSAQASGQQIERFRDVIRRLDRPLSISCDERAANETRAILMTERARAREWLSSDSRFFASGEPFQPGALDGIPLLYEDLQTYMEYQGLIDMEHKFATQWMSNSESGEFIKGFHIVVAESGLSPFEGTIVRDPSLFDEPWSRQRRSQYLLQRMAFVQEVFSRNGIERPMLYRTLTSAGPLERRNTKRSFISGTFNRDVAEALFAEHDMTRTIALYRQTVPLERLFMTYLETEQFNHPFKESEAVLICDPANLAF